MKERSCYHTCPLCGTRLTIKSTRHGNVYNCSTCRGAMANLPVLKGRVGHGPVNHFWQAASLHGKTSHKACPFCRRPMVMFASDQNSSPFSLELCKQCKLIWFDKHENQKNPTVPDQVHMGLVQEMAFVEQDLTPKNQDADLNMDFAAIIAKGLIDCLT